MRKPRCRRPAHAMRAFSAVFQTTALRSNDWVSTRRRRQFQRYGMFEGHMCFKHKDYLNWLWSSEEISSLSSIGLPLKSPRTQ